MRTVIKVFKWVWQIILSGVAPKGWSLTQVREEKWAKDRIGMQCDNKYMVKVQVSLEDMIIFGQVFYTKVLLFDFGEASLCSPCRATLEGSGWYVIIPIF